MRASNAILFVIVLNIGQAQSLAASDDNAPSTPADIEVLIDQLQEVSDEGMGYSSTQTGREFLPLGISGSSMLIFAPPAPTSSDTMREIVSRGADAIPYLIEHLDDDRVTAISPPRGMLHFLDEYDVNVRTTNPPELAVEPFGLQPRADRGPRTHRVTVGDLCFVALGQIVNRQFNAVRYQPTLIVMVNSPTRSEQLRDAIRDEWEGLTPDGHRASLIRDFLQPDHELRRLGACLRIGYYYPELLEPLAVTQLSRQTYNVFDLDEILQTLYTARHADERREAFDAAILLHGEVMGEAILQELFMDLEYRSEELPVRECLVDLYGYPEDVEPSDRPMALPDSDHHQARLVETLALFPTHAIDGAVREVMHDTDDEYLALCCSAYFVGRGGDDEIQKYVAARWDQADATGQERLQILRDRIGWTPLHLAAQQRNAFRAIRLMDDGADVNACAANGQTPLHVACEDGAFHVAQALLDRGADRSIRDALDRTPLDVAQDGTIVHLLLAGTLEGTDIFSAAIAGRHDLVQALLESDPALVSATLDWQGLTPLHLAAQQNQLQCVEVLLKQGADVNAADDLGRTPLHVAAACDSEEMVELLLSCGADPLAVDSAGRTPHDVAHDVGNADVIEALAH